MPSATTSIYANDQWFQPGRGSRYKQLYEHLAQSIRSGLLDVGVQLPPEREIAELADVSRVTVRKAVAKLVTDGLIDQRRGSGSFVRPAAPRLEQSLSSLISFSENIRLRGQTPSSDVLERGIFSPSRDEFLILGLTPSSRVARIKRLRFADEMPLAIETSTIPADILPNPLVVDTSLYDALRELGRAPVRAIQRVTASNLTAADADLLHLAPGDAVLNIQRTAMLPQGRTVELTKGLYRSDLYDFVSELKLEAAE